jgi:metallophosphoesterase (TIGR00282 family)
LEPLRILMLGDIVGRPGRTACRERVRAWREKLDLHAVIANGENASGGNGLTVKNAGELLEAGIDLITGGNHIWSQKDYPDLFEKYTNVIRPANYPAGVPGSGWGLIELGRKTKIAVLNLQGQVFMDPIDSPFAAATEFLPIMKGITPVVMVDFHAEATSERNAMGVFLNGSVSAVFGTHTHVASADGRILPGGTAYQTDLGMVGPVDGILGVDPVAILQRFLTCLPVRFEVAGGPVICSGAVVEVDPESGKALSLERFEETYEGAGEKGDDG